MYVFYIKLGLHCWSYWSQLFFVSVKNNDGTFSTYECKRTSSLLEVSALGCSSILCNSIFWSNANLVLMKITFLKQSEHFEIITDYNNTVKVSFLDKGSFMDLEQLHQDDTITPSIYTKSKSLIPPIIDGITKHTNHDELWIMPTNSTTREREDERIQSTGCLSGWLGPRPAGLDYLASLLSSFLFLFLF